MDAMDAMDAIDAMDVYVYHHHHHLLLHHHYHFHHHIIITIIIVIIIIVGILCQAQSVMPLIHHEVWGVCPRCRQSFSSVYIHVQFERDVFLVIYMHALTQNFCVSTQMD